MRWQSTGRPPVIVLVLHMPLARHTAGVGMLHKHYVWGGGWVSLFTVVCIKTWDSHVCSCTNHRSPKIRNWYFEASFFKIFLQALLCTYKAQSIIHYTVKPWHIGCPSHGAIFKKMFNCVKMVMFHAVIFVMGGANNLHYVHAKFQVDKFKLHHQKLIAIDKVCQSFNWQSMSAI